MSPALPEFPRIMQDPSTESVARACRACGRAGIPGEAQRLYGPNAWASVRGGRYTAITMGRPHEL